ncbi:hypothetical protein BH20ACT5_BH20ACT5_17650 [soil metagenome]
MNSVLVALSTQQHGVFSAGQAVHAGYCTEEIQVLRRQGRWRRIRRGVYADAQMYDAIADQRRELHLLECAAVQLVLQRPFVLSHSSAAHFYRLPFLGQPPTEVCGTDSGQARYGKGYRISACTLAEAHVDALDGWRLTSGARTVVDLARAASFKAGVVLADGALRLGLATPQHLRDVVLYCSHLEGIGRAGRVCGFADGRAESVLESVSRVELVARGVPVPQLQVVIGDDDGIIGRVDMLWEDLAVAGEADGKIKYTQPWDDRRREEVLWEEKCRMERLQAAGLEVVRWTNAELQRSPGRIVERFWAAAARRPTSTPRFRVLPDLCRTYRVA